MRILQLVANLDYGGLERLAIGLARQQRAAGHEAAICCLTHEGALADEARESGIEVAALDKKPGFSPLTLLKLARILRRVSMSCTRTTPSCTTTAPPPRAWPACPSSSTPATASAAASGIAAASASSAP